MADKEILKIDLHMHSTASDGTLTPVQLARKAYEAGLSAAALTDHDTVDGIEEFCGECMRLGIEAVPGIEISAEYHKEMHILGLFVDKDNSEFNKKLDVLKNAREIRNRKVFELIRKNGMDITEEDVIPTDGASSMKNIGRVHFARAIVKKGYAKSIDDAFAMYLKKGNCCYAKRVTYSPAESIRLIKEAGGTAVLAHPVYITEDYDELYALLKELKGYGLDGTECLYNSYTEEFSLMCGEICGRLGLVKTGGSDFHGANKPDIMMGRVSTGYVPYRMLLKIKEQRGL